MIRFSILLLVVGSLLTATPPIGDTTVPPWGFFGHRRINRLATFTLPVEMMPLFRANIDYLSAHAVDPDKRRYATANEAPRHYIDLDHWGEPPFADLPRSYAEAVLTHATLIAAGEEGERHWRYDTLIGDRILLTTGVKTIDVDADTYRRLWWTTLLPSTERELVVRVDSLTDLGFGEGRSVTVIDSFSEHGILPYHLLRYHRQLTEAFVVRDLDRILQLAAEMGHYVGDAHVPLHTTENYNGQLTGQLGIHAFWESRLPELFADDEYDYFVGPAEYIPDPQQYYWDVVLESHALVDSVLNTERRLRATYPASRQRCNEERLGKAIDTQCTEYSRAWSEAMNGMVEDRFRASIRSVGSVWYSCWVDAGQPDLSSLGVPAATAPEEALPGRAHTEPSRIHE